mgnify:FL=1|jgi:acyl dehydratase
MTINERECKEMRGKYFDEWNENEGFETRSRTITETDVVMFAGMTGDYNELHTNEEYMKGTQFGRRIVHGLLGLSISHGLLFRTGFLDGTAIAFVGIEDWKFIAPIYFGDTIRARVKVAGKIPSKSKKDRGIIMLYLELLNQDNVIVQSGYKTLMMKRA